jgi:hypothetical protein
VAEGAPKLSSAEEKLRAAGITPGTPEARAFLKSGSSTTINNMMPNGEPLQLLGKDGWAVVKDPNSPTGHRVVALPGSQAARSIAQEAGSKEQRQATKRKSASIVVQDIGRGLEMLERPDFTGGAAASATQMVPGSDAYNFNQIIASVKGNIAMNRLQAMREASPTGGALGSVTEGELKMLERSAGSIDVTQPPGQLEANLKRLQNQFADVLFGTPEQIEAMVQAGEISREEAAPLMFRHQLPFDERGRPVQRQGAAEGETDFSRMSVDEVLAVDVMSLSPKQREQLAARMDELGL